MAALEPEEIRKMVTQHISNFEAARQKADHDCREREKRLFHLLKGTLSISSLGIQVSNPVYCSVCSSVLAAIPETGTLPPLLNHERSMDSILQECHGGRTLHYGASRTWQLVKERFQAKISIRKMAGTAHSKAAFHALEETNISWRQWSI